MGVKLLTEHHLEFLSFKGGCTGSSESTLVKMPSCWKSRVTALMCLAQGPQHNDAGELRRICRYLHILFDSAKNYSYLPFCMLIYIISYKNRIYSKYRIYMTA